MSKIARFMASIALVLTLSVAAIGIGTQKAEAAMAYSSTWRRSNIGNCIFSGRQTSTRTFELRIESSQCFYVHVTAYAYNTDRGWITYKFNLIYGQVMRVSVDSGRDICYVWVQAEDTLGYFNDKIYYRNYGASYWY